MVQCSREEHLNGIKEKTFDLFIDIQDKIENAYKHIFQINGELSAEDFFNNTNWFEKACSRKLTGCRKLTAFL